MKRSKFIVFLSALLCAVMLFASCGETVAPEESGNNPTPDEFDQPISRDSLSDIIKTLTTYLEYAKPEGAAAEVDFSIVDTQKSETITQQFKYMAVVRTREVTLKTDVEVGANENVIDQVIDYYQVKNIVTDEPIFYSSRVQYTYGTEPAKKYEFRTLADVILEVKTTEAVSIAVGSPVETRIVYEYYAIDSGKIATVATNENTFVSTEDNGDYVVSIDGRSYVVRDGKIIYKFLTGVERPLPQIDAEFGDYKYLTKQYRGSYYLQVLDKNYVCVLEHKLDDGFSDTEWWLLGNGNVLFSAIYPAEEGGDYDYCTREDKYGYECVIINPVELAVTEPDIDFIVERLISANQSTSAYRIDSEYNIADIIRYDKETNTEATETVVLDNTLKVVASIPKMLLTQNEGLNRIRFVDQTHFVFSTKVKDRDFTYIVDTRTAQMKLISNSAVYMDGYFYTDKAVYNYSLERLLKLGEDESIVARIGNGLLITDGDDYSIFTLEPYNGTHLTSVAKISDGDAVIAVGDDYLVVKDIYDEYYASSVYRLYNSDGRELLTSSTEPVITEIDEFTTMVKYTYLQTVTDALGTHTQSYEKVVVLSSK